MGEYLNLSNINGRIDAPSDIHGHIGAERPVVSGESVHLHLRRGYSWSEIQEWPTFPGIEIKATNRCLKNIFVSKK